MKAIKLDKRFMSMSPLDRFLERVYTVGLWGKLVLVLGVCGAFLWFLYFGDGGPFIDRTITRYRLAGTWDVRGALVDWRFGSDGTFREEGLLSTEGSYRLLEGDRIRITGALGLSADYTYEFDDLGLLLTGENTPRSFRLTRKD
ncbi:MAG: hypothetical protein HRU75_04860 [Planctomycetia bacterium]|nr:MAG: hypothetical protein HRU75_04860 [Planctomycetia bacterium]